MTTWILETAGLFVTTIGALIAFLHLYRTSRALEGHALPAECAPLFKDRRLLMVIMGLMAAWFLVQYVGIILI